MIANVVAFIAVATTVAIAAPCGGVFNTGCGSCGSSFGNVYPTESRVVGFVSSPQQMSRVSTCDNNVQLLSAAPVVSNQCSSNQVVVSSSPVVSQCGSSQAYPVSDSGSCGSSSFGPSVFPVDSRVLGFVSSPQQTSGVATVGNSGCQQQVSVPSFGNCVNTAQFVSAPVSCNQCSSNQVVLSSPVVSQCGSSSQVVPMVSTQCGSSQAYPVSDSGSCGSSSFGPSVFPVDSRVLGFVSSPQQTSGVATVGNSGMTSGLVGSFFNSGCNSGCATQMAVETPVMSSDCNSCRF